MLDSSKKYLKLDILEFKIEDISILQKLIAYHSNLYYNKDQPIISDGEYDVLFKKLTELEIKFNINNKESEVVGSEFLESTFKKVKHSRPMISLDNTYNEEDLNSFNERIERLSPHPSRGGDNNICYTLEFKFDGLGIELIYKNGKLVQAITRGNGVEGEDVTQNIMQIDNIPKKINYNDYLEVRGEVVMPISSFESLNKEALSNGEKVFSNPRNAASGSLRMKDNTVTKKRKLKFFAYDLANSPPSNSPLAGGGQITYYRVIKNLEKLGFDISSYFKKCNGIQEIIDAISNFGEIKNTIDFEIDGLVLKVNDISLWKTIGSTEHHPRYAIAYKFPAEIFTTKILSVEHSVGRTGAITPVANLEPVNMGGAIIKRATLHNYEEVLSLGVRVGDTVFIKRAGEVIPKIISVSAHLESLPKGEGIISPPEFCPSCETKVQKDENKVRYYCPNNIDCPAKHSEKLTFAVGKQGFDIDGFGEKQVKLFLDKGIIHNLVDIFKILEKRDEILELEGFQEKSVNNLIKGVEKAKNINISTFLTALGISGVGKKTAKTLSKMFKSKFELLNFSKNIEELENLEDIGPEIAKNVIDYFNNEGHKRILSDLSDILNINYYKEEVINFNSIFTGKKMCITGSFEGYKREELAKILEKNGGEFVSSISKNTDYLLAGEKAGSKLKKANNLGVEVIDLTLFLNSLD